MTNTPNEIILVEGICIRASLRMGIAWLYSVSTRYLDGDKFLDTLQRGVM